MAAGIPNASRYLRDGAIRNAAVECATANYLDVLGLRPSLGRWFDETEERPGAPVVGVLGYQTWTRAFRADRSVIGRVIRIEGVPVTIVGVGPANLRGTVDIGLGTDFWLPITALPLGSGQSCHAHRVDDGVESVALSRGLPMEAVAMFLGTLGGLGLVLASIGLYAVVAFAVARRSREIGIRMALGARGQQVVWTIVRGVAGLIGVGTSIGLFLSILAMLALRAASGSGDIGIGHVSVYRPNIDPVALLAIAAVTVIVGVAAVFVPARRAARMHPLVALRHE